MTSRALEQQAAELAASKTQPLPSRWLRFAHDFFGLSGVAAWAYVAIRVAVHLVHGG